MSDEFEKKSGSKKGLVFVFIVLLLIAAVVGGIYFVKNRNEAKSKSEGQPEAIIEKTLDTVSNPVEEAFGAVFSKEDGEKIKPTRVTMNLSAYVEGDDAQTQMINSIVKDIKLKTVAEIDVNKKLFNGKITASYAGSEIINAAAFLQNEKVYIYLKDLYNKYIEVNSDALEDAGVDLESTVDFKNLDFEKLSNDIEKIVMDKLKTAKIDQEKTELNGDKVQKTTITLTAKDLAEITVDVLKKVNEIQKNEEISDAIEELEDNIEDVKEMKMNVKLDIYTKGSDNDIVKVVITAVEDDQMAIVIDGEKQNSSETLITISINENGSDVKDAKKMAEIKIKEDSKNSGTITISGEIEGIKAGLNITYNVEEDITVSPVDITESILITEMTEEDTQQILENAKKNPFLKSIIESGSSLF